MSIWYVVRDNKIVEQEDLGEDGRYIYFPAPTEETCGEFLPKDVVESILEQEKDFPWGQGLRTPTTWEQAYPDGKCKVDKVNIGCNYFRSREDAEKKLVAPPPVLIEPSDAERATWTDVTKEYVYQLEQAWDSYYQSKLNKYNAACGKYRENYGKIS
jgi:hypothetical protein